MEVGSTIKALRRKKKLTQQELADLAGLSRIYISQIENGIRPSDEVLKKISAALEIPESFIYIYSIKKEDITEDKRILYDQLFPVIQDLIKQFVTVDND